LTAQSITTRRYNQTRLFFTLKAGASAITEP
jgi:hypothetical protein